MYLTYQISNKIAHIDAIFSELINIPGWRVSRGYVRHANGIFLHRLLTGACGKQMVDHIDGNPLNNMLSNLRICTHAENMKNRKTHSNNKLGVKGVYRCKNRWVAQIRSNGKKYRLGSFESIDDAKAAYEFASKQFHKEFSRFL